jgi:hypothetical protein
MKLSFTFVVGFILLLVSAFAEAAPAVPETWSAELRVSSNAILTEAIQPDDLIAMTAKMVESGFDDHAIIQAQGIIRQTIEQNIPPTPIYDKAMEGLAKGVPAPRLVAAMHQVRERYEFAHRMATSLTEDPDTQAELRETLAAAQAAGIDRQNLEKISESLRARAKNTHRNRLRNRLLQDSLATSRDLARRGIVPEVIEEIISGLLAKDATANEIQEIARALNNQHVQLSMNERALICLQIIRVENSSTVIMEKLQQQTTFRNQSRISQNPQSTQGSDSGTSGGNGGSSGSGGSSSGSGSGSNKGGSGNSGSGGGNEGGNGGSSEGNGNDGGGNNSSGGRGESGSSHSGGPGTGQSDAGRGK